MGSGVRSSRVRRAIVSTFAAFALVAGGMTVAGADAAAAASGTTPVSALPGWLHTSGSSIKTAKNKTYVIKAIAWFGMETATCAPHGLWQISLDAGLGRIARMGFNTIRLPFSNECLAASATNSIDFARNPALAGLTPLQVMDYVVARAKAYHLNVILDRHRPDSSAQSALWYTDQFSEARWISDWKMLAARYKKSSNVIGFDLHNEPHGDACWGCGNPSTDWRAAATRAGNAVLAVNPKVLIIVEGVERQSVGTPYIWWGGGLAGVKKKPVVLKVKHRVVYSPHDYPATVYNQPWFSASNYPKNLPAQWTQNWGYIDKQGIAPILLGEFGTKLESTSDKQWLKAMVKYLGANKMSFAYWSFNPNSGDTGGIVKDDWTSKQSTKLRYLKPIIGSGRTFVDPPPTSGPPVVGPPVVVPPVVVPPSGPTKITAVWMLQNSWGAGYVAEFNVTAGKKTASGWTISWPDAAATSVVNAWGITCRVDTGVSITCDGADWAKKISPGQTMRVGLQVNAPRAPSSPVITATAR